MKNETTDKATRYWVSTMPGSAQYCIQSNRGLICAMESGSDASRKSDAALIVQAVNEHAAHVAMAEAARESFEAIEHLYNKCPNEQTHAMVLNNRAALANLAAIQKSGGGE